MKRIIKCMQDKYLLSSLEMVKDVFTASESEEDAKIVTSLVEEIRAKKFYLPELEFIMVDESDEIIGYCMFSKFHLGGKYEDELLILNPVAVKTALQRQHISKELIEYGFEKAKELGFKVVIVEGNPLNYRNRGFQTSAKYNIVASESVGLPDVECMMVKELVDGALDNISGVVDYSCYDALQ